MGILDWFRNRPPILEKETAPSDETTRRAIDKAVTLVNPRLRLLPDYQERLSPAINTTIDYLRASLTDLPQTLRLSPAEWASEPLWRVFFASTDDISRTLAYSKGLKTLFDKYPEINEACFILGMNIRDQRIDGMTLHGDMVQRNVPQRVLGFSRHVARICGKSEAEVRRLLGIQSFEYLVSQAIARLGDERSGRQGLEDSRALIRARLRLLQQQGPGLGSMLENAPEKQDEQQRLEAELLDNERQLEALGSSQELMDEEIDVLVDVLSHPEAWLGFSQEQLRLDTMNVVLEEDNGAVAFDVKFSRAHLLGEPNRERAFVLASIRRDEMPVPQLRLDEVARYL